MFARRCSLPALIALAVCTTPAAAHADLDASLMGGAQLATGLDSITDGDAHGTFGAAVSFSLPDPVLVDTEVELLLEWQQLSADGVALQNIATDFNSHSVRGGARFRNRLFRNLDAHAAATLGYTTGALELRGADGESLRDRAHGASAALRVGLDLAIARRRPGRGAKVDIGIRLEAGYTYYTRLGFTAGDGGNASDLPIPVRSTSLGDVGLSGFGAGIGLFVRL